MTLKSAEIEPERQPSARADVPTNGVSSDAARARGPSPSVVAWAIGRELGESSWIIARFIQALIDRLGEPAVRDLVARAHQVQADGGMYVASKQRKRTLGGVFLVLGKAAFGPGWMKYLRAAPPKRRAGAASGDSKPSAPAAAVAMEALVPMARAAAEQRGEATIVRMTLVGRPERIEKKGLSVVFAMESRRPPALPRGVPTPPSPPTAYTVFVGSKQWSKVEEALADAPDDLVVIDGYAAFVPELSGMGLFATSASTKALDEAKKQQVASTSEPTAT